MFWLNLDKSNSIVVSSTENAKFQNRKNHFALCLVVGWGFNIIFKTWARWRA